MKPVSFSSSIEIRSLITSLDLFVFIFVFFLTILAVIYGNFLKKKITVSSPLKTDLEKGKDRGEGRSKEQDKAKDKEQEERSIVEYLLMGRQLTLPLFVGTLVATWYGGIFGVTQIAFEKGMYSILTQGIFWYITYLLFAFFLVKRIRSTSAKTLPELVHNFFGPSSAKLTAYFCFVDVIPVTYVISLGLFLKVLFGGSVFVMSVIGMMIALSYSLFGGFRAVVFSDFVQFIVMCLAVLFVVVFSYLSFGGIAFLKDNIPEELWSFTSGESLLEVMVWGFLALSTLVNPCFYQRCFSATSTKTAKRGIIIATLIWFFFDLCTTFGALYARAVIPDAPSNQAYFLYAMQLLPSGFRGLVMAGILATILSTLDSYLFIAGSSLSYDIFPKKWRNHMFIHHMGVLGVAFFTLLLGLIFDGNIREIWKAVGSYSAACLLFPVLFGFIFPNKISDKGFVSASLTGVFVMSFWSLLLFYGVVEPSLDKFYIGCIATMSSLALQLIIHTLSQKKLKKLKNLNGLKLKEKQKSKELKQNERELELLKL